MWIEIVAWGLGIALSPTVTIAVILLLMSPRPRANAGALAAGWLVSLTLVAVLAFVLVFVFRVSEDGDATLVSGVLRIVLGTLLVAASGFIWWRARLHGAALDLSRLTRALDAVTPRRSFVLGLAIGDVKSFILTVAAATAVAAEPLSTPFLVLTLPVFVVVASLGVLVPTAYFWLKGDVADQTLSTWRDWLEADARYVMAGVSLLFGLALIGRGVAGLAA